MFMMTSVVQPATTENPESLAKKNFTDLQPLTPGSRSLILLFVSWLILPLVHGYSLLRTQINSDYFNDIFDESLKFQVPLEGHRKWIAVGVCHAKISTLHRH